jgi:hypothetical protein
MQLRMAAAAGVVPGPAQQLQMLQFQQAQGQQLPTASMGAPAFPPAGAGGAFAPAAVGGGPLSYPVTSNPLALAQAAAAAAPAPALAPGAAFGAPLQPPAPVSASGGFSIAVAPAAAGLSYGHAGAPYGGDSASYATVVMPGDPTNVPGSYGAAAPGHYGGL